MINFGICCFNNLRRMNMKFSEMRFSKKLATLNLSTYTVWFKKLREIGNHQNLVSILNLFVQKLCTAVQAILVKEIEETLYTDKIIETNINTQYLSNQYGLKKSTLQELQQQVLELEHEATKLQKSRTRELKSKELRSIFQIIQPCGCLNPMEDISTAISTNLWDQQGSDSNNTIETNTIVQISQDRGMNCSGETITATNNTKYYGYRTSIVSSTRILTKQLGLHLTDKTLTRERVKMVEITQTQKKWILP